MVNTQLLTLYLSFNTFNKGVKLFEVHDEPDKALCDGPSALPLAQLEPFLAQVKAVDDLVKAQPPLVVS